VRDLWQPVTYSEIDYEREFIVSLNQHITYVQEAGRKKVWRMIQHGACAAGERVGKKEAAR
jgi:hypothetical protein